MKTKTFSVSGGGYVAPTCKVYSITAETQILNGSENSANRGYIPSNDLGDLE